MVQDEWIEVFSQNHTRFDNRIFRGDGPVGPYFENETVEVRSLPDAHGLCPVADAPDRRKTGVDGNDPNLFRRWTIVTGGHVAASALNRHLHFERHIRRQGRDEVIRIDDRHGRVCREIACLDLTGGVAFEAHCLGILTIHFEDDPFDIEENVGDVLEYAIYRREFVRDTLDLDRRDGSAFQA